MIQANELRIGNTVMYNGRIYHIRSGEDLDWLPFDGIALTEELLLNMGFHQDVSNDDEERIIYSIQISNNNSLYFDRHKDWMRNDLYVDWYISHEWDNNHYKNNFDWINIKYAHQLQNLYFSLTNSELVLSNVAAST